MLLKTAVVVAAVLAAAPSDPFEHIRSESWKAAEKSCTAAAEALATSDDEQSAFDLAICRALVAAGRGEKEEADWYWWVAGLFGRHPDVTSLAETYGTAGTRLAEMIRPALPKPPPRKTVP